MDSFQSFGSKLETRNSQQDVANEWTQGKNGVKKKRCIAALRLSIEGKMFAVMAETTVDVVDARTQDSQKNV